MTVQSIAEFMQRNWGWIASFLAFSAGILTWTVKQLRYQRARLQALEKGVQALLRSQMNSEYRLWAERGYAPLYARDNFENLWNQYEALGANGVMTDIYNRFRALPTEVENHD